MRIIGVGAGAGVGLFAAKMLGFNIFGNIEWRGNFKKRYFGLNFPDRPFIEWNELHASTLLELRKHKFDIVFGDFNRRKGDIEKFLVAVGVIRPRMFILHDTAKNTSIYKKSFHDVLPDYRFSRGSIYHGNYSGVDTQATIFCGYRKDSKMLFRFNGKRGSWIAKHITDQMGDYRQVMGCPENLVLPKDSFDAKFILRKSIPYGAAIRIFKSFLIQHGRKIKNEERRKERESREARKSKSDIAIKIWGETITK